MKVTKSFIIASPTAGFLHDVIAMSRAVKGGLCVTIRILMSRYDDSVLNEEWGFLALCCRESESDYDTLLVRDHDWGQSGENDWFTFSPRWDVMHKGGL